MTNQNNKSATVNTSKKHGIVGAVTLGAVTLGSQANAALTLDTAAFATDIATAEAFAVAVGLLMIAFVAVVSLVKKSRGSVK